MKAKELNLTEEQKRILKEPGDLLVIAGPGTGKTYTLFAKITHLLENEVKPSEILLLAYNLKIAEELKKKAQEKGLSEIKVDTFHGLAYDLWTDYHGKTPPLITEAEKKEILKKLFHKQKNPLKQPQNLKTYHEFLLKNNLLDFELLLNQTQSLLPHLQQKYVVIDEFQDLSPEIWDFLTNFQGSHFVFFGDPNQCIYGFKGVNLEFIKNAVKRLCPSHKVLHLSLSFRCPENILKFAEKFKCSPWSVPPLKSLKKGGTVQGFQFNSTFQEKKEICKLIKQLLGGLSLEEQKHASTAPKDIFVLSRLKAAFYPLKEFLQEEGIPVSIPEEEAELKYNLCCEFLAKIETTISGIEENIKDAPFKIRVFLKNLWELTEKDKDKFKAYLKSLTLSDFLLPATEGVNFLSIHASKGLEARHVFLIGAEEGLLPLKIFPDTSEEEERRLLYVAITRAKESFFFSAVTERKVFNFTLKKGLSRFFKGEPIKKFKKQPRKPKQVGLF